MPKPNKENIITAILEELGKGTTFELMLTKVNCSRPTFAKYWKIANERHLLTQNDAQEAIKEQSIAMAVDGAKLGLKSRMEYCLEIQKQLDDDVTEESILDLKTGKVTRYFRKLYPMERKALYERISKFQGMDAPVSTKSEVIVTDATINVQL